MISSPISIEKMYPPVSVALLLSDKWQRRFREYFLDSREFDIDSFQTSNRFERPHRNCISVCLFKQNANNRIPKEFAVNEDVWYSKYWNGLLNLAREIKHFPEWKLRIYVENDL